MYVKHHPLRWINKFDLIREGDAQGLVLDISGEPYAHKARLLWSSKTEGIFSIELDLSVISHYVAVGDWEIDHYHGWDNFLNLRVPNDKTV